MIKPEFLVSYLSYEYYARLFFEFKGKKYSLLDISITSKFADPINSSK
jgi:hypothetical protein